MENKNRTRVLIECALMLALATVLSKIEIPLWLQGGSITLGSMVPIVLISFRHGTKWGLWTAFLHGAIQMGLGFHNVLYCKTLITQIACILLDYIVAYTGLGFAFALGRLFRNPSAQVVFGSAAVSFFRFLCSFLSGILVWGEYAPAGTPVWIYSLGYNGGYMLPEGIITAMALLLLYKTAPQLFAARHAAAQPLAQS